MFEEGLINERRGIKALFRKNRFPMALTDEKNIHEWFLKYIKIVPGKNERGDSWKTQGLY